MTDNNGFSRSDVHTDSRLNAEHNAGRGNESVTGIWDRPGKDNVVGADETDADRRDLRAEIGKFVSLCPFPATAEELIETATANQASDEVLDQLNSLEPGTSFPTTRDLWITLGLEINERF
jgi:hypothetical protein